MPALMGDQCFDYIGLTRDLAQGLTLAQGFCITVHKKRPIFKRIDFCLVSHLSSLNLPFLIKYPIL